MLGEWLAGRYNQRVAVFSGSAVETGRIASLCTEAGDYAIAQ